MTAIGEMIRQDKTIEIAKNSIKEGLSTETIKKITGLDESTIKQLQAELNKE